MFKLLIVDDERLDREGLKEQIEWGKLEISVVDTAKNGFEALRAIEELRPDILITDVKMPGMTGLELAQKAAAIAPWIKVIFISGFDDFEYVKSALLINAYEYILKPVDNDELLSALRQAMNERLREKKSEEENRLLISRVNESKHLLRHKFLCDVLYGIAPNESLWSNISDLDVNVQEGYYRVLLCEVDDYKLLCDSMGSQEMDEMHATVAQIIGNVLNDSCFIEYLKLEHSRYALILSFNSYQDTDAVNETVKTIADEIMEKVKRQCQISLTIGIGCMVNQIEDIYLSYNDSCQAVSQKMFVGKGMVLHYRPKTNIKEEIIDIQNIGSQLMQSIKTLDLSKACYYIDYLFDNLETSTVYEDKYVKNCCINIISRMEIVLMEMNERMDSIFGRDAILWDKLMKFETILDIRQWMKNVFRSVIEHLDNKNARKNRKVIEMVIKYVEENYSKELTLKDIASQFYYSPNYLGSLFKEELGHGFAEFLTEFRMKKAGELLKQPHLKMYEVASLVGYKNVPSFINQFKVNYKMTPKEYRERC